MEMFRCLRIRKGFKALLVYVLVTIVILYMAVYKKEYFKHYGREAVQYSSGMKKDHLTAKQWATRLQSSDIRQGPRRFKILWYKPPVFLQLRPDAMFSGFDGCPYSNCVMSYVKTEATISDAIIFTGRLIPTSIPFSRPVGQIWIFYEHEPPFRLSEVSTMWNQSNTFNWTMVYDKSISDIHLPYGAIRKKMNPITTNVDEIIQRKNGTALLIMSHCDTPADRLRYVEELKRYIDVDVLGKCGKEWTCGKRFVHDDCFELINNYKFYLAFENSFCNNYFTEKIFDNFDYDAILVTRGGKKGQVKEIVPEGTVISADDFKNAKELGEYLKSMTPETYRNMLKKKLQYTSLGSYNLMFHNAMCDLCDKMNNINKFRKTIEHMSNLIYSPDPCIPTNDIE